ncbi:MAG: glycosyltransferase family 2 protein [Myxococcales bacterium]|nr:glycosyltransferase family 2 protein [Myxococcales bacterium]
MAENPDARYPDISLSVVIPAYNEEQNLAANLPRALDTLRRMVGTFELILINDCSKDKTGAIADELAEEHPELRVFHNEKNLRQGGTLARGFRLAKYDWVIHNAMDYPFDFEDLPLLLDHLPEADIVVASRRTYPGITVPRKMVSFANRAILWTLFGATVKDYNFIQLYRRTLLQSMQTFSQATSFITPEKIIRAHAAGLKVVEVEVEYHRREVGTPSSANVTNIKRALGDMGKLWLELKLGTPRSRT